MNASIPPPHPATDEMPSNSNNEIRIERIKSLDLITFAEKYLGSAKHGQFIPITMQRAIAHANNPLVDENDVGLLVAFHGDECVGFFGIMPVLLKNRDKYSKVSWFTTWRVSPHLRGKSIGSLLMKAALSLGRDYLIVGSSSARKVCQRFGFLEREPLEYCYLDVSGMERLNPATWVSRLLRKVLKPLNVKVNVDNRATRGFSQLLSPLSSKLFRYWLWRSHRDILKGITVQEVDEVQPDTPDQIAGLSPVILYRGAEIVNWMLKYPWVVEAGQSKTEKMDYYFTDVRDYYRNITLGLSSGSNHDYRGYAILSVSTYRKRMALRVLDTSFNNPVDGRYVLPLAIRYAHEMKADVIDLSTPQAEAIQSRFLRRVLLHRKKRIYQCFPASPDSPLAQAWPEIEFHYCDGDMAFS
jgi:GNAT superfamily N-acetyltransferase